MSGGLVALAGAWWSWIAPMSVQAALLGVVVAAAERLARGRLSPRLRLALWGCVALKLVLPPTLSSPLSLAHLPSGAALPAAAGGGTHAGGWTLAAFVLWLVGLALLGGLAVARQLSLGRRWRRPTPHAADARLHRLARRAARRVGLRTSPPVHVRDDVPGPLVLGVRRPIVVLPRALVEGGSRAQLEHVLLHELAHVRRRDPLRASGLFALQILYWFHPVAWWMGRRLGILRELGCDRAVARALGGRTLGYRRTLLQLARAPLGRPVPRALGFLHPGSALLARLELLERPGTGKLERATGLGAFAVLLVCCVPLARPPQGHTTTDSALLAAPFEPRGCLQRQYLFHGLLHRERSRAQEP